MHEARNVAIQSPTRYANAFCTKTWTPQSTPEKVECFRSVLRLCVKRKFLVIVSYSLSALR